MKSGRWSDGPAGDEAAASGGLLRLLGRAGSGAETGGTDGAGGAGGAGTGEAEAGAESAGDEPGTGSGGAWRRIVTGPLVCRYCEGDRFEVTSYECFCEGCCLPLDVRDEDEDEYEDGDGCGGTDPVVRELRPPTAAARGGDTGAAPDTDTGAAPNRSCPAGHDLFQVAAAYTLDPDGHMRRLSVGLRCPADGALGLLVDDVRMTPAPVR
ncbi:hypothetical protein AB0O51_16730 [Streptomyces sp. NPDC090301]|uniref:hypothetical protein n=1 Tax=Streptomyces sp. NPDC090301 TaxID=3154975 RepID=UPI003429EACD